MTKVIKIGEIQYGLSELILEELKDLVVLTIKVQKMLDDKEIGDIYKILDTRGYVIESRPNEKKYIIRRLAKMDLSHVQNPLLGHGPYVYMGSVFGISKYITHLMNDYFKVLYVKTDKGYSFNSCIKTLWENEKIIIEKIKPDLYKLIKLFSTPPSYNSVMAATGL